MNLGRLSSEDLIILLDLLPLYEQIIKDGHVTIREKRSKIFSPKSVSPSWCHLYELPYNEHLARFIVGLGAEDELIKMAESDNPPRTAIQELQKSIQSDDGFDLQIDENSESEFGLIMGVTYSLYLNYKSLLTFGLYINEQVAIAKEGGIKGDKAIFNAVKIDPTVIGCPTVSRRISQAILEDDQIFIEDFQNAFRGNLTKRQHRVYQLQRLVLQVLLESKAPSLPAEKLYELFTEELKIAARDRDSDIGDVANNLRQFAYQFLKQKPVS